MADLIEVTHRDGAGQQAGSRIGGGMEVAPVALEQDGGADVVASDGVGMEQGADAEV